MEQLIREERTKRDRLPARIVDAEDREMEECIARLKKWQTECLLAPRGMDRFASKPEEGS